MLEERATRQATQWEWRNAAHRSVFMKSDAASTWVLADPDLMDAWARDWSVTTTETSACWLRHLNGELAMIDDE